jgi:malto-oligosyltrehalose synthase
MTAPRATIRLQFNNGFTFDDAARILPYLSDLGISHIYTSPIMVARTGSSHGYDVVDPTEINPELGGYPALQRLSAGLKQRGMGLIIDIVPNHMAADIRNPWWRDVLELGPPSRYAGFFDIDWRDPDLEVRGKILLPCLGDSLDACLERGELALAFDAEIGGIVCRYFDQAFPLSPRSRDEIAPDTFGPGRDPGRHRLRDILMMQHYRLTCWRDAATRINWRRFFDINQLVALRMDRADVFAAYHRRVLELFRDEIIDGLRVDHIDGLADPGAYCRRLRAALRGVRDVEPYIVVEKILERDESLNRNWPVDGSTGYDFMNQVAALLHDARGEEALSALWHRHAGDACPFEEVAQEARREIVQWLFPKQLDRVLALLRPKQSSRRALPYDEDQQRRALIELLAVFRRYRLYGDKNGFSEADDRILDAACEAASQTLSAALHPALDWLCEGLRNVAGARTAFQQLSATLAAKAVEDTAFYRYGRLLSRNEVGADPGQLAITPEAFHGFCVRRRSDFPRSMLATATHDQKRGEDTRARLAILSEIPREWGVFVERWLPRQSAPDPAVQLMVYQTLIGAWPLSLRHDGRRGLAEFHRRVDGWLLKALREAKRQTSWSNPDAAYEKAWAGFLANILDPGISGEFLVALQAFVDRIAPPGAVNSLSQTLLRLTTPGIPDLYQGTEFWDFSLVDPDNRDAVDFSTRQDTLAVSASVETLMRDWRDGRIKQWLIARVLNFRKRHDHLFAEGEYVPLPISGPAAAHLVAALRRHGREAALILAPRHCAGFLGVGDMPLVATRHWADTVLQLPADLVEAQTEDVLNGHVLRSGGAVAELLGAMPVALCHLRQG